MVCLTSVFLETRLFLLLVVVLSSSSYGNEEEDSYANMVASSQQQHASEFPPNDHRMLTNYQSSHPASSPGPSATASRCLARIRLAATFDPTISSQINRFIDSMRIDRLRRFVCEKTAYFCNENEQHEVGDMFQQYEKSIDIINQVKTQLSSTEKDQLNMMENLNDTLAEQTFFIYKFHQLNPIDLAVLTSAKTSLTSALATNQPDPGLSRAMGTFSPQDLERIAALPTNSIPEEIQAHLARCQISNPDIVQTTISFLISLQNSKNPSSSSNHQHHY